MYPRRSPTTHTEQLGDEASVYDWARVQVHALNPTAACVWRHCDGATSPETIAAALHREMGIPEAEAVVELTLRQLARLHLLELPIESHSDRPATTRRWLLRRGVAAAMLPVIYSIVAPSPVDAQSSVGPPTLTALAPAQGTQGSTVVVALTGTNFIPGGTTVNVSGTGVTVSVVAVNDNSSLGPGRRNTSQAASFVNSNTLMTASFVIDGAAAPGARNVSVTTVNGTSNSLSFTVNSSSPVTPAAPTLTNVSPNQDIQGATVAVTLTGTNFVVGATTVTVAGSGVTVNTVVVGSSTSLTASFVLNAAAAVGPRNVTVTTAGGTSGAQTFTVNAPAPGAPTLTSVSPNQGIQGATVAVTLMGTNFVVGATTVTVAGGGVTVNTVVVGSSTSLTANFALNAAAPLGARNVTVTTAAGTSGAQVFTVNPPAPTLTSVSPNQGIRGTAVAVTLTGTNFVVGATTVTVAGGGVTVANVTVGSSTSLTASFVLDLTAAGSRTVTVTTAGGTSGPQTFTISLPPPGSTTFVFSGAQRTFIVPAGVVAITIQASGAQGGFGSGAGLSGLGGRTTATVSVTPGAALTVLVGGKGRDGRADSATAGGFNGGGGSAGDGGGGGGASSVSNGATPLVVVGGGGGAGAESGGTGNLTGGSGGGGGGLSGSAGGTVVNGGGGGGGGTQVAGGAGGAKGALSSTGTPGTNGAAGQGGSGGAHQQPGVIGGGGGGGGYFGGGGGGGGTADNGAGGGGGGSSFAAPGATGVLHEQSIKASNGGVTISW